VSAQRRNWWTPSSGLRAARLLNRLLSSNFGSKPSTLYLLSGDRSAICASPLLLSRRACVERWYFLFQGGQDATRDAECHRNDEWPDQEAPRRP
jgi:hypothetical protein